jgi:hypothetical protein
MTLDFEVAPDPENPEDWTVLAVDRESEGECYLAIFSGPHAETRAREYAAWKNGQQSAQGVS